MFKLHPEFDAVMREILQRDADAIIVVLASRRAAWTGKLRERLDRSLGPLGARVHFVPRMKQDAFLHLVARSDVALDPFHFGGNNSICEALSQGIPVVTLPAPFVRGRFTLGHYRQIGIDSCIASTPEEYVDIALRLAREPEFRAAIRKRILAASDRLFDRTDSADALGTTLIDLVETRRSS